MTDGLKYSIHKSKIGVSASPHAKKRREQNLTNQEAETFGDCDGSLCSNFLAHSDLVKRSRLHYLCCKKFESCKHKRSEARDETTPTVMGQPPQS